MVRAWKVILDKNPGMSIKELEETGMLPDSLYAGAFGTGASPLPQYAIEQSGLTAAEQILAEAATPIRVASEFDEQQPEQNQTQEITKEDVKKLTKNPTWKISDSGYISEYIILTIIIAILLSLVMLTIF